MTQVCKVSQITLVDGAIQLTAWLIVRGFLSPFPVLASVAVCDK